MKTDNKTIKLLTTTYLIMSALMVGQVSAAGEEANCEHKGLYVISEQGHASTASSLEIGSNPPEEQLGKWNITLVNDDWSSFSPQEKASTCRTVKIKNGIFRGRVTSMFEPFPGVFLPLIDHTFTNDDLDSTLNTKDDVLDPFTLVQVDACTITAIEQINVVSGTNRFGDGAVGSATGTLFVDAEINFCTGQNHFNFIPEHNGDISSVCFDAAYCP